MREAGAEPIWVNAPDADYACNHANCLTKGSYRMGMRCDNCAARFIGRFTKGHETGNRSECSRCGCKTAHPMDYLDALSPEDRDPPTPEPATEED